MSYQHTSHFHFYPTQKKGFGALLVPEVSFCPAGVYYLSLAADSFASDGCGVVCPCEQT